MVMIVVDVMGCDGMGCDVTLEVMTVEDVSSRGGAWEGIVYESTVHHTCCTPA
jgi:hypothetical protein